MRFRSVLLAVIFSLALLSCVGCAGRAFLGADELERAGAQIAVGEEPGGVYAPQTSAPETASPAPGTTAPAEPIFPAEQTLPIEAPTQAEPSTAPEETTVKKTEPVIKTRAIAAGSPVRDTLLTAGDEHNYTFTAKERGMIKVTVTASSKQNLSSRAVEVYAEYFLNGVSGETGLRLLTRLDAFSANGETATPCIGIAPGKYVVRVVSGDVTALSEYTLRLDFTARTDYEIETNDTPSRYSELVSGIQTRGSARFPEAGKDVDWYLFRMYYDGALSLKFRHATGNFQTTAFKVTLYNDRFEEIYTGLSAFNLGTLQSGTLGVKAGIYYVRVENRVYYDGDYGITVTAAHGAGYEAEPNDLAASATLLPTDRPLTAALTARDASPDRDCFSVTLKTAGTVRLTLDTAGGGEANRNVFRLTLLTAAGEPVYARLISGAETACETPELGLSAGRYLVVVDNEDLYATDADYTVCCRFTANGAYETEPNETPETADSLTPGVPLFGTVADGAHAYDTDCFTFTLAAPRRVELALAHGAERAGEIYTLELLDPSGAAVKTADGAAFVSVYGDAPETVLSYALKAGTYTVRIRAGLFRYDGAYALTLQFPGQTAG